MRQPASRSVASLGGRSRDRIFQLEERAIFLIFFAATAAGCFVEEHHYSPPPPPPPSDTRVQFDALTNMGYACGGPLTSWSVSNRTTADNASAGCDQPILFVNLTPNASYVFDIQGYSGGRLCWRGTCSVAAAGWTTSFADCSGQIEHLCGL